MTHNVEVKDNAQGTVTGLRVAVIGTGTIGAAMARRLLAAGAAVDVWNRSPEPAHALAGLGARVHADPHDAVDGAAVVLTLLPTGDVARDVMVESGVVDAMAPGAVWAQMGTIGVDATASLDAAVAARRPDLHFVDAPVSGSKVPAESGQLVVLASGPEAARTVVDPVFSVLGRRTLWLGPAGAGTRMKTGTQHLARLRGRGGRGGVGPRGPPRNRKRRPFRRNRGQPARLTIGRRQAGKNAGGRRSA